MCFIDHEISLENIFLYPLGILVFCLPPALTNSYIDREGDRT